MTKAQLQALLLTIAQGKFQTLVDWYTAVNTGNSAVANQKKLDVDKWDQLTTIVNAGINQLDVITNLTTPGP